MHFPNQPSKKFQSLFPLEVQGLEPSAAFLGVATGNARCSGSGLAPCSTVLTSVSALNDTEMPLLRTDEERDSGRGDLAVVVSRAGSAHIPTHLSAGTLKCPGVQSIKSTGCRHVRQCGCDTATLHRELGLEEEAHG